MIKVIIEYSVRNKLIVLLFVMGLVGTGIYSLSQLPIDAVPDITNNQVQVVTVSGSLAPQEVEQFITYPVEMAIANIPNVTEIRSISRFGLSVVTVVFAPEVPVLEARQYVKEQLDMVRQEIPKDLGNPELMPITTGLGEIYQYVLRVKPGYEYQYSPMELRTIQDWIVKRQLAGTRGIIEVSSFGGYLKQYEVALDPIILQRYDIAISEVFDALARNNQNTGGSYIEKGPNAYYIRTEGMVQSPGDIEQIVVANTQHIPVRIKDLATVQWGSPKRFGAMTMDGQGEAVGGITLMFKGANSSEAIKQVHQRIEQVQASLPEGVELYPYLDRSVLVGKTINTVKNNLLEGGLIVVLVLILLLGNFKAGLIVASVIPLAMLFALILMKQFGLSANLMSLGAIDFGIVVDGAVIIIEGVLHGLFTFHLGKQLTQSQMDNIIIDESARLFRSSVFGVLIILTVFIPIMTLTGIEGKMFRPMAMTFSFAIIGALILSLTYVPMMAAWALSKNIQNKTTLSDRIVNVLRRVYRPVLERALELPKVTITAAVLLFSGSILLLPRLGAEFLPTLEEGDLAMQMAIQPGSSLEESIKTATKAEQILLDHFPEVEHVVSKIGTAEVPTDPMAIEDADIMIILKPRKEWVSASTREELVSKMKAQLEVVIGASFEFTQPIQLRFNELLTGAKTDIAVKIFGENTSELKRQADRAAEIIKEIPGAGDVKVEQTEGLPQLMIDFNRQKIAEYGLDIQQLNTLVRTAYAGETAGIVYEDERKFDLVVRLKEINRQQLDLQQLFVHLSDGRSIPMSEVAQVKYEEGPMQISREGTRRRIIIGVNVRDRDVASLVEDIKVQLRSRLDLPSGYFIQFGGQFENLEAAKARLSIAVPVALLLIFVLLYLTFANLRYTLMIFTAVPTAAIGGILGLWVRGMPFSISAGVGFIALFGVAVLNGIVLISYFNRLREENGDSDIRGIVIQGGIARMRPVVMTALVAALGFLPMALSTSNGAEVQKPLATVVIGGLITATLLTLLVLPVLYYLTNKNLKPSMPGTSVIALLLLATPAMAQQPLTLDYATQQALERNPDLQNGTLSIQQAQLGITVAREIPQTEFMAGFGQFNTTMGDYQVSVTQPLSPFGLNKKQAAAARVQLALSGSQQMLMEHQVIFGIRQARQNWLTEQARLQLYQQQEAVFQNLTDRAGLQLRAGAIDRLSYTLAQQQLTQAQSASRQALQQEEQAFRRFQQLAYSPYSVRPGDSLEVLTSGTADTTAALQTFLRPLEQEMQAAAAKAEVEAQRLQPQLSFGYMQQSIRPDLPLNAVQIGLRAPVFQKSQRARIAQAELETTKAAQQLRGQRQQLEQERQMAQVQLQQLAQQLEEQGPALQAQARQLRQLAQLQLEQGEVNYFQYAQSLNASLSSELELINLTARYNQAVLYLEFLSQ